jgi:integrase
VIKAIDRADGRRYQVYGKRSGKKVYLGTFASRKEAIAADEDHRTTQRRIAAGELPSDHDDKRTFSFASQKRLEMLRDTKSRSYGAYECSTRIHLVPVFGNVSIVEIHKPDVIRWRDNASMLSSPGRTNAALGALSSAFTWFVNQRWIDSNPCSRVRRLAQPTKLFPWLQSTEQVTRLIGECSSNIRDLVAVLVGTGVRLDEALHLHWDDVDLEHRLLTVHRGRKGMTKSGKMRRIPILDSVLPVLKQMKLGRGSNTLLWPGGRPAKALSQPSVRKPFKRAVEHAELPEQMRIHDLRHSFASLWLIDGGDIFKLSRILGHSSVTITERTYAHLRPDAFGEDYGRVAFRMPREDASPVRLHQADSRRR